MTYIILTVVAIIKVSFRAYGLNLATIAPIKIPITIGKTQLN